MSNRILQVEIRDRSPAASEAELWVTVTPERRTGTTEVHGRLMGPRCLYASTVEVAYPLRPRPGPPNPGPEFALRVIIPEASLWDPVTPFLYEGPLELWEDGERRDQVMLSHGVRLLTLGPRGLRLNGRPLSLRGRAVEDCSEEHAADLRREGVNLVVVPVRDDTAAVWDLADRVGLLVLGRQGRAEVALTRRLDAHACCLGWLAASAEALVELPRTGRTLLGIEASTSLTFLPPGAQFVAVGQQEAPAWASGVPHLSLGANGSQLPPDRLPPIGTVE